MSELKLFQSSTPVKFHFQKTKSANGFKKFFVEAFKSFVIVALSRK